ncbi:MAG: hypothetical protein GWP24_03065 [Alphaproteobacteria bacterium]|jgi:hypothetical protein|nr:hypothetical protein [Alphaproteobacteria bacterium]
MSNKIIRFLGMATLLMTIILARQASAESLIVPAADYTPLEVIEIQLLGLQSGDPVQGIEQVWVFAHPFNKRATGPLARFRTLFEMPAYAPLLDLRSYSIKAVSETAIESQFVVSIVTSDGVSYDYFWAVEKVLEGDQAGFWMTTMVSSPRQLSRAS